MRNLRVRGPGRAVLRLALVAAAIAACGEEPTSPGGQIAAVYVTPAAELVHAGDTVRLSASAIGRDGLAVASPRLEWTSSDAAVAEVDAAGLVRGVAAGSATITVTGGTGSATAMVEVLPAPGHPMREVRALWISRYDWRTAADVTALLERAAAAGFNVIYFQVRGSADAFYRSSLEPWSDRLSGTLGQDPGWDPLGLAVAESHARGMELHAWINAFTAWPSDAPPPESSPRHVVLEHPDWILRDAQGAPISEGSYRHFFAPASAGARTRLAAVAAEIARSYAVDGVHLDYIRFPSSRPHDRASVAAWDSAVAAGGTLDFDDFRRSLVSGAVREVSDSLRAAGSARLSAAVWGVYTNARGWPNVSTGFGDRLQDARGWTRDGIIDALAPMVYWTLQPAYGDRLDFAYLADEHASAVTERHVYVGIYADVEFAELRRQVLRARKAGAEGVAVFSAQLLDKRGSWQQLGRGPFQWRAEVPGMAWK